MKAPAPTETMRMACQAVALFTKAKVASSHLMLMLEPEAVAQPKHQMHTQQATMSVNDTMAITESQSNKVHGCHSWSWL